MQQVPAFIHWLQVSDVGTGIRESIWFFPVIETMHVLMLAMSVGTFVWFDLRVAGLTLRQQPVSMVHRQVMPWAMFGYVVMFITGILLFWSEAEKCYNSGFFRIKIVFLFLAGVNALIFELGTKKSMGDWDKWPIPPMKARMAGIMGLVLWTAVIIFGRATAYNLF